MVKEAVERHGVSVVVVDAALSPVQQRNLEKVWGCKVIDRTGLILEIFGERARTKEGALQVELAQLQYLVSRLPVSVKQHRFHGGIGMRGPGESPLQLRNAPMRRRIRLLKDKDDNYIWQPSYQMGQPDRLLGLATDEFADMPDVTANQLCLAVADWMEAYQIVDREGFTVLRDPYTAKPKVEFYCRRRVGGAVLNTDAIKIGKLGTP
jgi:hypothetical protein